MEPAVYDTLLGHLDRTSRSFSLGIRGLASPLQERVALGYLLCRVFDTFEDSLEVDSQLRLHALRRSGDWLKLLATNPERLRTELGEWSTLVQLDVTPSPWAAWMEREPAEIALLRDGALLWETLTHEAAPVRQAFEKNLTDMVSGMIQEVERRQKTGDLSPRSANDTDAYCYAVAGTVGGLLTDLFELEGAFTTPSTPARRAQAIAFGKALQIVNILKDFHADWKIGRCFWPGLSLPQRASTPPPAAAQLEAIFADLAARFREHAQQAKTYVASLNPVAASVKFFCEFPLVMAERTLQLGEADLKWLRSGDTFKVSRSEVFEILAKLT